MTISIVDHELPYDTHNLYNVSFYTDQIHTLVTHASSMVESWLARHHTTPTTAAASASASASTNPKIVGLDVEWRPNFSRYADNAVATLQLCLGADCLIYQLIHTDRIPKSLSDFLADRSYKFVGVGIESDIEKLLVDYDLGVANWADLGALAAEKLGVWKLRKAGLKGLAKEVLGKEVQKPKRVTLSRWDSEWLTCDQVQYACVDAFLSFEIARHLNLTA